MELLFKYLGCNRVYSFPQEFLNKKKRRKLDSNCILYMHIIYYIYTGYCKSLIQLLDGSLLYGLKCLS